MTATSLKIVIDVDGCLADFHGAVISAVGPPDSQAGWAFEEWYKDPEQVRLAKEFTDNPQSYVNLQPLPGARKAVRLLDEAGHKLYVVTARPKEAEEITKAWLDRWFRKKFRGVYVVGQEEKVSVIQSLHPHMIVDDNQTLVTALRDIGLNTVVFHQAWNVNCPPPRAMGWLHFRKVMGV